MKKAQLSINTIVITIIALAVLITLILFFTGKFAEFSGGISDLDQDSTSDVGCMVACNLQKSGAGTPFTQKQADSQCSDFPCDLPDDSGSSGSPGSPSAPGAPESESESESETIP